MDTTAASYGPRALFLSVATAVFGPKCFLFSVKICQYPTTFLFDSGLISVFQASNTPECYFTKAHKVYSLCSETDSR